MYAHAASSSASVACASLMRAKTREQASRTGASSGGSRSGCHRLASAKNALFDVLVGRVARDVEHREVVGAVDVARALDDLPHRSLSSGGSVRRRRGGPAPAGSTAAGGAAAASAGVGGHDSSGCGRSESRAGRRDRRRPAAARLVSGGGGDAGRPTRAPSAGATRTRRLDVGAKHVDLLRHQEQIHEQPRVVRAEPAAPASSVDAQRAHAQELRGRRSLLPSARRARCADRNRRSGDVATRSSAASTCPRGGARGASPRSSAPDRARASRRAPQSRRASKPS